MGEGRDFTFVKGQKTPFFVSSLRLYTPSFSKRKGSFLQKKKMRMKN